MKWNDEYWPLLLQAYNKKPAGVKHIYSRAMIELALTLHIPPQELQRRMVELEKQSTPFMKQICAEYKNPNKLKKAVKALREKEGYGTAGRYFDDIETRESWELDFRPLEADKQLMPVHLIIILDLYFYLTPTTMVTETDEVQEMARLLRIPVRKIVQILDVYKFCDPYLNNSDIMIDPLLFPCKEVWNRFGNDNADKLNTLAVQLQEYFR